MPGLTRENEKSTIFTAKATEIDRRRHFAVVLMLLAIALATIIAYGPVLGNYFNGDDFVHLVWLRKAMLDPELLWRNFHSAWLDIPTARFYRPLISCFMMADYLAWNGSGFGFHLTNLICHLASSAFLYLVLDEIIPSKNNLTNEDQGNRRIWKCSAVALFALYPLHAEAVSWITGRVDTIVTMFFLASFWCYLRWRSGRTIFWLTASCIAFVLSLLSKEMAIMLPAVMVAYEFILHDPSAADAVEQGKSLALWRRLLGSFKPTLPFWLILCGFVVLRTFALGTFVGGYDDSIMPRLNGSFLRNLFHSTKLLLLPFNKEPLNSHFLLRCTWTACLLSSILFGLRSWFLRRAERNIALFLMIWLVLLFVPVFKLLSISDDLQGSRLVYLPSAPLAVLLSFGFSMLMLESSLLRALKITLLAAMVTTAGIILHIHNLVWQAAGEQSQAIVRGLNQIYTHISDDPLVFLVGLPDTIDGAYVARNAIEGMTKSPQLSRDTRNCFMLDNFDHVFPFGLARGSMNTAGGRSNIFVWDKDSMVFALASLPKALAPSITQRPIAPLKELVAIDEDSQAKVQMLWQPDGSLSVRSENKKSRPSIVFTCAGMPCFNIDCLTVDLDWQKDSSSNQPPTASLLYRNDLQKEFDPAFRLDCHLANTSGHQTLTFPLHSEVNWAMGGMCQQLKLLLPPGSTCIIRTIATEPLALAVPKLSLKNADNQYNLGYVQLNRKFSTCAIDFDVSLMPNAHAAGLEVTRPNTFFQIHNSAQDDSNALLAKTIDRKKGRIYLRLEDFPNDGIYEARLRTLDTDGKPFGFSSDHIVITINH